MKTKNNLLLQEYLLNSSPSLIVNIDESPIKNQSYYNIGLWVVVGGGILALFIGLGISLKVWLWPKTVVVVKENDSLLEVEHKNSLVIGYDEIFNGKTGDEIEKNFKKPNSDEIKPGTTSDAFLKKRYHIFDLEILNKNLRKFDIFNDILKSGDLSESKSKCLNENSDVKDVQKYEDELTTLRDNFNGWFSRSDVNTTNEEFTDEETLAKQVDVEKLCLHIEKGIKFSPKILEVNDMMKSTIGNEAKLADAISNLEEVENKLFESQSKIQEKLDATSNYNNSVNDIAIMNEIKNRLGIQIEMDRSEILHRVSRRHIDEFNFNKDSIGKGIESARFINEVINTKNKITRTHDIFNYISWNFNEIKRVFSKHSIATNNWEKASKNLSTDINTYSDQVLENQSHLNLDILSKVNINQPNFVSENSSLSEYINFLKQELENTRKATKELEWKTLAMESIACKLEWLASQKEYISNKMDELKTLLNDKNLSRECFIEVSRLLENCNEALSYRLPDISTLVQVNLDLDPVKYIEGIFDSHIDVSFDEITSDIDKAMSIAGSIEHVDLDSQLSVNVELENEFMNNQQPEETLQDLWHNQGGSSTLNFNNDYEFKL